MRRGPLAAACLALLAAAAAAAGTAARGPEPGVTATSILLGATAPLSGPASASASVRGAAAYFEHVNAGGGVGGRSIRYVVVDDAGDPARTVEATRLLVERERVFALFNAHGTEENEAVRGYVNARGVPQLFVDSGASSFGAGAVAHPATIGFRPSARAEGWVLGRFLARTRPGTKVAALVGEDADGRDLLAGFRRGLASSRVRLVVVAAAGDEAPLPDVESQLAELKTAGADALAVFATPATALQAYVSAGALSWRPLVLASAVSSPAALMRRAASRGAGGVVGGAVSAGFLKDPSDPGWADDRAIRLYRAIMARYARVADPRDVGYVYGMAAAYALVEVLRKVGSDPRRAAVLGRVRDLTVASNPFLLPGIAIRTGPDDGFPIEQLQLRRWQAGRWRPFGGLWTQRAG